MPLSLDVIVNNHNYAPYVGRAIDSALDQDVLRLRVIVVDDGSTDDSRRVIEGYAGSVVPVFKDGGGQASAFNAGLATSSADVVMFLDADDALAPGIGERAIRMFEADPSLARLQYRMQVMDESGNLTETVKPPAHVPMPNGDIRREELAFPFDLAWMATSGNAFATWALRRIFPVPEAEFPLGADWYVVHLASLLGRVASLDHVGSYRRVHGRNQYEPFETSLDLRHVRQNIYYADRAREHLGRLAAELGFIEPPPEALSISDLANRLVSLKLEPAAHPLEADTVASVLADGVRASVRRFNVRWPMRLLFAGWFVTAALAPRPLARPLAEVFFFPERRRPIGRLLAPLHVTD